MQEQHAKEDKGRSTVPDTDMCKPQAQLVRYIQLRHKNTPLPQLPIPKKDPLKKEEKAKKKTLAQKTTCTHPKKN